MLTSSISSASTGESPSAQTEALDERAPLLPNAPPTSQQAEVESRSLVKWLQNLPKQYDKRLLFSFFASQHLVKGFVFHIALSATDYLYGQYSVPATQMQVYEALVMMPWCLKPIYGMCSDLVPVWGYRKGPYIVAASLIGVASHYSLGFAVPGKMDIQRVVCLLFGVQFQVTVVDLLMEARYSEVISERPAGGPDIISFIWIGINMFGILSQVAVGKCLEWGGPQLVFSLCCVPASLIIWSAMRNDILERFHDEAECVAKRMKLMEQPEIYGLSLLMLMVVVSSTLASIFLTSPWTQLFVALVGAALLLVGFHLFLRPSIAKFNTYYMLQASTAVVLRGATFYFYTDGPKEYPDGPHFSVNFFTTCVGTVSWVFSLIGVCVYNKYMKNWKYAHLLNVGCLAHSLVCLLDVLLFARLNKLLGIPDTALVLGSQSAQFAILQWMWMPGMVCVSQMCPKGMEATMFALLAGNFNYGQQVARFLGGVLLDAFKVDPAGLPNEGPRFERLWQVSLVASLLPLLSVLVAPFMVPDARQTDDLLQDNPESATVGSWLSRRRAAQDSEAAAAEAQSRRAAEEEGRGQDVCMAAAG
mmetsp:Transcript_115641/g.247130  ORF Transcript_115641/g.247130 Transcript_115641/m.247130 type:complete len:588 (+) Transcript_115641:62-1825(+)